MICEISEVTGETRIVAEEQVDQALNVQKKPEATVRKKGRASAARDH